MDDRNDRYSYKMYKISSAINMFVSKSISQLQSISQIQNSKNR